MHIGIDPGKMGGIAALGDDGMPLWVRPTPLLTSPTARDQYDLSEIVAMITEATAFRSARVTIEKLQPLPPVIAGKPAGGSIANYNRGVAVGWCWMFAALRISYELVTPQAWQKVMLAGVEGKDSHQRTVLAASRLFPGTDLRPTERARKPSDGMAAALLLAEFGRSRAARGAA
jgi:hypothetical protein